jgi:hypothetical protein
MKHNEIKSENLHTTLHHIINSDKWSQAIQDANDKIEEHRRQIWKLQQAIVTFRECAKRNLVWPQRSV